MQQLLQQSPTTIIVLLYALAAVVIAYFGIKMTFIARDLAKATRLGEAVMGAVFVGAATSLSGIIASATAAWHGNAPLAVSNSLGGIAAQTMFLVLGDMVYRKSNLEFAAASIENLMMSAQLLLLLSILYGAFLLPDVDVWAIHPASILLILVYIFTVKMLVDTHEKPMWLPRMEHGTVKEVKNHKRIFSRADTFKMIGGFIVCAFMVGSSGWIIAHTGIEIVGRSDLSASVMGGIFVAFTTSLPELIIAVTAVRMGSLTLAVGDIVGGNAFDTLFIAVSDIVYREGSIYSAVTFQEEVWLGCSLLMTTVLLLGLMYRQKKGFGNIGLESSFIMLIYVMTVGFLLSM